ncbi:MAG: right-handed parallel beta-helix repeat-containing protein [Desulfobulbaceae bacterium]
MRLNIKPAWIKLIPLVALLAASGCQQQQATELAKQTIDQDTTWSGTVVISGDIYVPPGVTLTIAPGTVVKFKKIDEKSDQNLFDIDSPYYPEAELIIRGRLIARGTPDKQIVFTSAEMRPNPADWGAINFLGSEGNVVEYAKIYCAYNGIHAHGSEVRVTNSEFARNGVAISFKKEEEAPDAPWFGRPSDLTITSSVFSKNKGAIGCRNSRAEILHNEIRENKFFGIWPKEDCPAVIRFNEITENDRGIYLYQVQGMILEQNNIYNNRGYDIAIAEAQDFPVNAANNWLGTTDPAKIAEKLFDKNDDPEVAEIQIQPLLDKPVQWKNK